MGQSALRRHRVKQLSGRFPYSQDSGRNKRFRDVNCSGKQVLVAFTGLLSTGYLLVSRPPVHLTISPDGATVPGAALSSAAFRLVHTRRHLR